MTATGFDFEPLPNGDVLIEFFGDDGVTLNTQVITKECLAKMPVVAHALFLAIEEGKYAAMAFLEKMAVVDRITPHKQKDA
jgi:hypothetical protein